MRKTIYLFSLILIVLSVIVFIPNTVNATEITVTNAQELADALAGNATVEGNKVTINNDINLYNYMYHDYTIKIDAKDLKLELDLASHEIRGLSHRLFYISSGTLIVNDSVGSGKIDLSGEHNEHSTVFFLDGGNLVVNEGEFNSNYSPVGCFKGNITINGGTFTSLNNEALNINIQNDFECETIINGGTFKGDIALYLNVGNVTINGGTFIGNSYAIVVSNWPNVLLNITGGIFEGTKSAMNISNRDDGVILSGGKFTATSTDEQENEGAITIFSTYYSDEEEKYSPYSPINLLKEGYTFYDDATIELKKVNSYSYYSQHYYGTKPTVTVGLIKQNVDDEKQEETDKEEVKPQIKDETPKTGGINISVDIIVGILSVIFIGIIAFKRK
ncbi:MAG: LPXTG cell wall anchor domain-containing protein [Clostridia bacterium]|nr:LPXTG cell wall anchor domain-containing protein [Clostridia bacterium]